MGRLTRRDFLRLSAGAAAAVQAAPGGIVRAGSAGRPADLTTLERTIVRGPVLRKGTDGAYRRLTYGPGEPFVVREELARRSRAPVARAMAFVHFTDVHIVDAQSPARVEFLDRYADSGCNQDFVTSAHRPQETLTVQVLEAMVRRINRIRRGPVTGRPFRFVMCTGDNIDNEQLNETRWFVDTLDGGTWVSSNSGGPEYEGVQAREWGDEEYWHPDGVDDEYKRRFGFPAYPGLLRDAGRPFRASGLDWKWLQTFGNHDGLMQGNAPRNQAFARIATGGTKFSGPPPGYDPCEPFGGLPLAPTKIVTPDPLRRIITRQEYVEEQFRTTGTPAGHGFTARNRRDGTAYYVKDSIRRIRLIGLDTVNPGGLDDGSIGDRQLQWLERKLVAVHSRYFDAGGGPVRTKNDDRLVILFSHHGLRSLDNHNESGDPNNPEANDLPRHNSEEVEALLHRFPNVIAWVNGHSHENIVEPKPDPTKRTPGFWDIGTAAHIDWSSQSRIIEIAVRRDGTLSIFCTMVDHDAPPDPREARGGVMRLASIHRELSANDPQKGFAAAGAGRPEDRNVELLLPAPAWLRT